MDSGNSVKENILEEYARNHRLNLPIELCRHPVIWVEIHAVGIPVT
jgi:hypothetical protein